VPKTGVQAIFGSAVVEVEAIGWAGIGVGFGGALKTRAGLMLVGCADAAAAAALVDNEAAATLVYEPGAELAVLVLAKAEKGGML
jgi:hypothetical protein